MKNKCACNGYKSIHLLLGPQQRCSWDVGCRTTKIAQKSVWAPQRWEITVLHVWVYGTKYTVDHKLRSRDLRNLQYPCNIQNAIFYKPGPNHTTSMLVRYTIVFFLIRRGKEKETICFTYDESYCTCTSKKYREICFK